MANKIDLSFHQALFDSSPNGITVYDPSLKCILINKTGCDILHVTEKEAIGKKLPELVPGIEKTQYKKTLATGKSFSLSFACSFNSVPRHISVTTCKVGENLALFVSDETSNKSVSDLQKSKTSELDSLLFGISSPVFFKDTESRYTSVNQACADFFNLEPLDIIGKTAADLMTREEAQLVAEEDRKILSGEVNVLTEEAPRVDAQGEVHWFSSTILPLKTTEDKIVGLVGISFDITQRKITEMELEILATALHQTSETIEITDFEGKIQYVNPAFEKSTGYLAEEIIGKNPSFLNSGKQPKDFYRELWETIKKGESWQGHFINKKKDGTLYEEEANISPVISEDGEITNFIAVKRDVTKEVTLESQLRQSQKMEAIGRLAGGIAHDFNNILTAILGYSEMILTSIEAKDPMYRKVDEIRKAGKRAATLTKQMLAFSKKQIVQHKSINVNETINDLIDMLKRIIGENVKLELHLDPKLDMVLSDKGQIEQILINLVVNSKDAVSDMDGHVNIETGNAFFKEGFSDGDFSAHPGAYVMIKVKDNGCGISDDNLKHIFEPFFTQKNEAKGTGLGLSTVYGIVKQHNGFINVESELGIGTAFKIYLPSAVDESSSPNEDTSTGGGFKLGSGMVMIVEDEQPVLELATSIIEIGGYTVVPCNSAEEAFGKFDELDGEIVLLITDIVLKGMRGDQMAAKLREQKPELKVLYMSGYAGEVDIKKTLDHVNTDFIEKPFSMEKLSTTVRNLLSQNE